MEPNLYVFSLIAALIYLAVGARLFALARRTRGRPEFLLALTYFSTGVSYFLYELPSLLEREPTWILVLARIIYSVGMVPLLLFVRDVFRSDARWANALFWAITLSLISGVLFSTLEGDIEGVIVSSVWFWFDWIGYTAPYVWIGAEALIAYSAARKRQQLGLCGPEVVHRFLLWALFGFFAALSGIFLIPLYLEYAATQVWPDWGDFATGGVEAASTVVLWFAFFPPAFYRRWIEGGVDARVDRAR